MAKVVALFALVLCLTSAFVVEQKSAINWPFTDCSGKDSTWKIESLTLSQQPARNVNDAIVASGTAKDHIEFSNVDLTVKLNGLFLHNENVVFVKNVDQDDTIEFTYNNLIPSFAPSGTYSITFNFKEHNTKDNGCMSFNFKI